MKKKILIFIFIILIFSSGLFAEGGEEHHFDWAGFIGKVLNSTILFGGLTLIFRKPLIEFLTKQSVEIKTLISTSETNLKEKTDELKKLRSRLSGLENEIEKMRLDAVEKGEDEKKKIEELGKSESERILKNSESEIDARVDAAVRKLKSKIAGLTIDSFKEDFSKKLDKNMHRKIIEKNIKIIGELSERD